MGMNPISFRPFRIHTDIVYRNEVGIGWWRFGLGNILNKCHIFQLKEIVIPSYFRPIAENSNKPVLQVKQSQRVILNICDNPKFPQAF
jgi:hypothetical protein